MTSPAGSGCRNTCSRKTCSSRRRLSGHTLAAAWLKRPLTRWFAKHLRRRSRGGRNADLDSYATFNEFFTRELKAGARPIAGDARHARRSGRRHPDASTARSTAAGCSGEGQPLHAHRAARRDRRRRRGTRRRALFHDLFGAAQLPPRARAARRSPDAHSLHSRRTLQRQPRDGRGDPAPFCRNERASVGSRASTARWSSSSSAR